MHHKANECFQYFPLFQIFSGKSKGEFRQDPVIIAMDSIYSGSEYQDGKHSLIDGFHRTNALKSAMLFQVRSGTPVFLTFHLKNPIAVFGYQAGHLKPSAAQLLKIVLHGALRPPIPLGQLFPGKALDPT